MTDTLAPQGRGTDLATVLAGAAAVVAVGVVRALVLAGSVPSGIDGGNWLAYGDYVRPGSTYPPLVPLLFARLVALAGPTDASMLAACIAACAPALAILGVGAWAGRRVSAIAAALVVATSGAVGEAAAWGGYPQLTAITAAVVALVALARYADVGSRRALAVYAVAIVAVVATSHLVAVPASAAAALVAGGAIVARRPGALRRALVAGVIGFAPLLGLARTYAALFATLGVGATTRGSPDVAGILGPAWAADVALLGAIPAGALFFAHRGRALVPASSTRDRALLVAAGCAAVAWGAAFLASGEGRLLYDFVTIAPLCALALVPVAVTRAPRAIRASAGLALAAGCAYLAAAGLAAFPAQVAFYRILTPGDFSAMEWLAAQPYGANQLVVADTKGSPIGWWAEGITGREALYASDLQWLRFPSERSRALIANALLYRSGFPDAASATAASEAGVRYVLLPAASAFGLGSSAPPGWRVAYAAGDALVLSPAGSSAAASSALPSAASVPP